VAISVTTVPAPTVVTGLPPADTCRLVEVEAGAAPMDRTRGVVAVRDPETPAIVTVAVANEAELLAVSVRILLCAVELGEKVAVTPSGRPPAVRLTAALNPFCGMTTTLDCPEPPGERFTRPGASMMVNLGSLMVRVRAVDEVKLPEDPVIVTVAIPGAAVLSAADRVSVLVPFADGLGEKVAVTPLGSPDAARFTFPANPHCGAIVMPAVAEPPGFKLTVPADGTSVKLDVLTSSVRGVVAVWEPDVPARVRVYTPVAAVAPATMVM